MALIGNSKQTCDHDDRERSASSVNEPNLLHFYGRSEREHGINTIQCALGL
jgi:hypothetical protein